MENITTPIEILFERVETYTKASAELLKLNAIDKSADVISSLSSQFIIFIVVAMFVITLSIGISICINNYFDSNYIGFFIVSLFYLIASIIIYLFNKHLIKLPIQNKVIKQMMK